MTSVNVNVMSPVNSFSNTEQRGISSVGQVIQNGFAEEAQATETDAKFVQSVTFSKELDEKNDVFGQNKQEVDPDEITEEEISELGEKLSSYAKSQVGLKFSQNDDPKCSVVSLVDMDTEEVIRQIPSEEILALRQRLNKFCDDLKATPDAAPSESVLVDTHI